MTLVDLDELKRRAHVVALPLRVPFRGVTVREAMLFEGPDVWTEWAPFVEYGPQEASRWLRSSLFIDAHGFSSPGVPVEVNATIPAVDVVRDPGAVGRLMEQYPGCTTVKVKVAEKGQGVEDDLARVRAVRAWFAENYGGAAATDTPKIRMDANGGWSVEDALRVIEVVAQEGACDYAEQPCATVEELAAVRMGLMRRGIFVRVAADESIRKSADPLAAVREVVDANACDVAVVKVPPLGGVDRLLEIADDVARRGVALTVSSALDTAVGVGAGLEAAACLRREIECGDDEGVVVPAQAAGLATGSLFEVDVARRPIVDGCIVSGPVVPDREVLERWTAPAERREWWLRRLEAAYQHLL
ncbi:o-succinylbenzoate synthase [Corynebacterium sp. 319]|uniref:o-succinylbenzoate synthase n=1 Tax=unclassified Corynebacterium TaxID=2624378 RepID=UPI00125CAA98|nr:MULTISPECIES: o-succinylbenzoate synthase [unclassified Corynebacterium]KAB1554541.1 o-succinylbenzoate synthase [Corynebacterium sp. 319]KAB3540837.1 o-succinylbenzoate synthase [Corynebacterium sp. 366]